MEQNVPVEELNNILGLLANGSDGSVFVLDSAIVQRGRHGNETTGEVRVVVQSGHELLTGWGFTVSGKQREEVVLSVVAGLDHEGKIRGKSSSVGDTANLFVLVRLGKVVGHFSGTLEHLSLIVGAIDEISLGGHLLQFTGGVGNTDQITVMDTLHRVTSGAHLPVHLESTAKSGAVIGLEESKVVPWITGRMDRILVHEGHGDGCGRSGSNRSSGGAILVDLCNTNSQHRERGGGGVGTRRK